jgi:hypothetical protein
MLIASPRLNTLAGQILEDSVGQGYSDVELLVVVTFLQESLLKNDRPLRAVIGSIINTADAEWRARFLNDLIGLCGDASSVH